MCDTVVQYVVVVKNFELQQRAAAFGEFGGRADERTNGRTARRTKDGQATDLQPY